MTHDLREKYLKAARGIEGKVAKEGDGRDPVQAAEHAVLAGLLLDVHERLARLEEMLNLRPKETP